jgi:UDP-N-acetylmuramyl pentapeptide phosphotransferase/UDP-N-acetylglucosamine-1-phosphate transferase
MLAGIIAFCAALGVVRVLFSERARDIALDRPNERSLHRHVTPRSGGVGILAGIAAGWLVAGGAPSEIAAPMLLLALVSFADDLVGLGSIPRFAAQLVAASWFLAWSGPYGTSLAVLLAIGIVWSANLYNFMDGSDGLAGGMAVIGFAALALAAHLAGSAEMALTAAVVAAAAAGFLVWNFNPARIFMGDAGSVPLGFLAAALGVLGWQKGVWPAWLPLLTFSTFAVDASVTLVRRIVLGERFWEAHRTHYYQRVIQMGAGHKRTALGAYALMASTALSALAARNAPPLLAALLLAAWVGVFSALALRIDRAWAERRSRDQGSAAAAAPDFGEGR